MAIQEQRLRSYVPMGGFDVVTEWAGEPLSKTAEDLGRRTGGFVTRTLESVKGWNARRVTRKQLAALSDHLLRDIGIERHEIDHIEGVARWPLSRDCDSHMLLERGGEVIGICYYADDSNLNYLTYY